MMHYFNNEVNKINILKRRTGNIVSDLQRIFSTFLSFFLCLHTSVLRSFLHLFFLLLPLPSDRFPSTMLPSHELLRPSSDHITSNLHILCHVRSLQCWTYTILYQYLQVKVWPSTSTPAIPSYDAQEERVKLVDYLQVCICMCVCVVQEWFYVCMHVSPCLSIYSSGCISQSKHILRNYVLTSILLLRYAPNM